MSVTCDGGARSIANTKKQNNILCWSVIGHWVWDSQYCIIQNVITNQSGFDSALYKADILLCLFFNAHLIDD